eukprot:TRINITY_DN4211_c0_g1_i1.p1 TRINITY_DN4211_c0_g1~~TRINITY_DN4211_c0_g1_i1.p1  ORF type:complete len:104 (+),score=14.68 TRINITY_DN4211_c0_g1_i1:160-471(+)
MAPSFPSRLVQFLTVLAVVATASGAAATASASSVQGEIYEMPDPYFGEPMLKDLTSLATFAAGVLVMYLVDTANGGDLSCNGEDSGEPTVREPSKFELYPYVL